MVLRTLRARMIAAAVLPVAFVLLAMLVAWVVHTYTGLGVRGDEGHSVLLYLVLGWGLVGLLVGGVAAWRMGRGVLLPMQRVSQRIERIAQGDLTVPAKRADDPLHHLQAQLDNLAQDLAQSRQALEQRVADVTAELRRKKEEAERATLAKSHFLAAASHDMRQPTHALGMFVARLGQLPMDGEMRPLVASLEASVQAMQNLLDGLLDLSRLDSGAVPVHVAAVNLAELLQAVEQALLPTALARGLRLRVRPTALWVQSDAVLLHRMILNLAHNALRYTESGTVLIACRQLEQGRKVCVQVWDSGIGISEQHQTEIFREFYQVGNPGQERTHGLGLGLNIVERSAQLLGHQVGLRSALGCGSRFQIAMPWAEKPDTGSAPVPLGEAPPAVGLEGLRVLVLEDDEFALVAVQELLQSWGCTVLAAPTLVQALQLLQMDAMPHVLISDYRLGDGTDGIHAVQTLRARAGYDIPACLMSGDTDEHLSALARVAGLTLLHKPVRPAKLRSLVRHLANP